MPPHVKSDEQTIASQSDTNRPSATILPYQAEADILPQPLFSRDWPLPAENTPGGRTSPTETQDPSRKPRATPRIRLVTNLVTPRRIDVLQQFEGVVTEVQSDEFQAQLSDLTDPNKPEEFLYLPIREISPPDRPLLVPGCIFYWILGYETREGGQITRVSEIRIRRSPPWSRRKVEAIKAKARETFNLLNRDGTQATRQD
jgi:hypothetical protein